METHVKIEKTGARDIFLRTIAVLGLIAILLLGAWGIIQLAFAIPTVFSNLGGSVSSLFTHDSATSTPSTKEAIVVTTIPATVVNGQNLQVSWMHQNADKNAQYSYAISYACQAGLSLKAPLPNGSYQAVPCNTLFNYVNASQHMTVVPSITGSENVALSFTVTATKLSSGVSTATGVGATLVTPTTTTKPVTTKPVTTTPKPATTTTKPATTYYPAATRATNLYGFGDLAVTITSVNPSTGATTVKFVIENTGTNVINAGWTFNATLPINGSYTFQSQPQQALYPGDKIAYSLVYNPGTTSQYGSGYGYPTNGYGYSTSGYTTSGYTCQGYTCSNNNVVTNYPNYGYNYGYATAAIVISADPSNMVQEYNKNNNTAQTSVAVY